MTATVTDARCSFCGKPGPEVAKIIAGPGVCICDECVALCDEILTDQPPRDFPSLDDRTDDELLADVARVAATGQQLDAAVRDRVRRLRARRVSWARIGEALGVSRQSAWERFSDPDD